MGLSGFSPFLVLLYSAGVDVAVVEQDVSPEIGCRVATQVATAIQEHTKREASPSCVAGRTNGSDLVELRIFEGLTKLRVDASHSTRTSFAELSLDEEGLWALQLEPLAKALFPGPIATTQASTDPKEGPSPWPWVTTGATVAILAVGTGFAISSLSARGRINDGEVMDSEYDAVVSQANRDSSIANALFVTGGVGVVLSALHFVVAQ